MFVLDLLKLVALDGNDDVHKLLHGQVGNDRVDWHVYLITIFIQFKYLVNLVWQVLIFQVEVLLDKLVHLLLVEGSYATDTI